MKRFIFFLVLIINFIFLLFGNKKSYTDYNHKDYRIKSEYIYFSIDEALKNKHKAKILCYDLDKEHYSYEEIKNIAKLKELRVLEISSDNLLILGNEIEKLSKLEKIYLQLGERINRPFDIKKLRALSTIFSKVKNLNFLYGPDFYRLDIEVIKQYKNLLPKSTVIFQRCLASSYRIDTKEKNDPYSASRVETSYCDGIFFLDGNLDGFMKWKVIQKLLKENINKIQYVLILLEKTNELPGYLHKFKNMRLFSMSSRNFTKLPKSFVKLKNLRQIIITNSQLKQFPKALLKLKKLEYINLSDNKISIIPKEIYKLTKLKTLDLRGNNINKKQLETLKKIIPKCNILTDIEQTSNDYYPKWDFNGYCYK